MRPITILQHLAPMLGAAALAFAALPASAQKSCQQPSPAQAPASLDFAFYKSNVEPIFLKARSGHARCYACHSEGNRIFHLEKLPPDAIVWTDEQSRKNFQSAIHLVVPGNQAAISRGGRCDCLHCDKR